LVLYQQDVQWANGSYSRPEKKGYRYSNYNSEYVTDMRVQYAKTL